MSSQYYGFVALVIHKASQGRHEAGWEPIQTLGIAYIIDMPTKNTLSGFKPMVHVHAMLYDR